MYLFYRPGAFSGQSELPSLDSAAMSPVLTANNPDNLQESANILASFSRVPCGFVHELRPNAEFCQPEVRRLRLGCGHWHVGEMWSIMNGMERAGLLGRMEAGELRQRYEAQDSELNELDQLAGMQASRQGEVGYAAKSGQEDIIQARSVIVDRLLSLLADHGVIPNFHTS